MKILLIVLMVLTPVLIAQTILFEDDFSDGTADGWSVMMPEGTYFVNDSLRYELCYFGMNDVDPCVVRGDSMGIYMTSCDYSVLLEGIGHAPSDYIGVSLRASFAHTGYFLWLRFAYNDIGLARHDGEGLWTFLAFEPFICDQEEFYWIRFECEGSEIRGKVWQGTPGDEPAVWSISATDGTYINNGCMGFATGRYSTSPGDSDAELDNVVVTLPTVSLDQSTWAGIKSAF